MMSYDIQDTGHVHYEFLNELIAKLDVLLWFVRKLLVFITEEPRNVQIFYYLKKKQFEFYDLN